MVILLKTVEKSRLFSSHLLHFYITVIRPVLEYASPLWHPTLTKSQIERLEAVQCRAIKSFCYSLSASYLITLELAGILFLHARHVDLSERFFRNISHPHNRLRHLLPSPQDLAVASRLRKPTAYPKPSLRTKRYCSAVSYALLNFQ